MPLDTPFSKIKASQSKGASSALEIPWGRSPRVPRQRQKKVLAVVQQALWAVVAALLERLAVRQRPARRLRNVCSAGQQSNLTRASPVLVVLSCIAGVAKRRLSKPAQMAPSASIHYGAASAASLAPLLQGWSKMRTACTSTTMLECRRKKLANTTFAFDN